MTAVVALVLTLGRVLVPTPARSFVSGQPGRTFWDSDTLLVSVELAYTPEARVMVAVPAGGALLLPTRDLAEFLDAALPPAPWTSTTDLQRLFPVRLDWRPRELRLVIYDDRRALGLSRRYDLKLAQASRTGGLGAAGGFWGSIAADDSGRSRFDAGYFWRNVVGLSGAWSSTNLTSGSVTIAAAPWAYLTYSGAVGQPRTVTARLAAGPAYLAVTAAGRSIAADALVTIKRASVFVSTRDLWVLTVNSPAGAIQLGRARGSTAARYSFGVVPSSPFLYPLTR